MPELTLEEIFGQLGANAKETFSEIKMQMETTKHIFKEVRTFGSTLTEHEVWIDTPSKRVPI